MSNNHVNATMGEILAEFNRRVGSRPTPRRQFDTSGDCKTCETEREKGNSFFPPHDASPRCESGKRPHCTCNVCF